MKKKSTAFFLAAVMMLTGIIPGSAPSAAADLFSDGTVQTAERMKLREDGETEETLFSAGEGGSAEDLSANDGAESAGEAAGQVAVGTEQSGQQAAEMESAENAETEVFVEEESGEGTGVAEIFVSEEADPAFAGERNGSSTDGTAAADDEVWSDGTADSRSLPVEETEVPDAGEIVDSGTCGENATWTLDSEGTLIISGTGEIYSGGWKSASPLYIVINDGITSIGDGAFSNCVYVRSISISSSVTKIGAKAFDGCYYALKNVVIPNSVKNIGEYAFRGCSSLEKVTLFPGVTYGEYAYDSCNSLTDVTIAEGVTHIPDYIFENCTALSSIEIPSSVKSVGRGAFMNTGIEKITVPSNVEVLQREAFRNCDALKEAVIQSGETEIGTELFWECTNLKSVTLPYGIKILPERMFYDCESLEKIIIPDSVSEIGLGAFGGCRGLKQADLPENLQMIGDSAFIQCENLEEIYFSSALKTIGSQSFAFCSSLKRITFKGSKPEVSIHSGNLSSFYQVNANGYFPEDDPTWDGITSSWGGGTFRWNVKPVDVSLDQEVYAYTGGEIRPSVTVTCEGKVLAEGEDYSLSYSNNIEVGTATVTVTGTGNYGSASVDFQIAEGNDIRFCLITMDESVFVYTGAEIEPKVTLTADYGKGDVLVPGVDYNISFGTNKAPGRGMVFLEGTGSYTGRKTLTFDILPRKTDFDFVDENGEFRRVGKFQMTWDAVPEADGYEIVYYRTDKETDEDAWTRVTIDGCENTSAEYVVPGGLEYHVEINAYHDLADSDEKLRSEITAKTVKVLPTAEDMWGFVNPVLEGSEVMGYAEYETFFSTAAVDAMFNKEILTNGANGICYGLDRAALEILLDGNPELSSLGVDSLYDVKEWGSLSAELRQKIRLDQIYQYVFLQTGDCQYEIPQILDKMDHYLETGQDPVILAVFMDDLGHALTALDYTTDTNGDICIRVYDSNWPGDEDRYVKLSGPDYSTWYYDPGWGEPWHGSTGTTYDENHVEEHTFFAYGNAVSSGGQDVLIVDTSKTDGGLDLQYFNNIKVILPAAVLLGSASAVPEGVSAYWIDRQDSYTIPNLPAGAKVAIASGNRAVEVTASEACDLVLSVGDEVENSVQVLSGKASSVETSFSRYSGTKKEVMSFAGIAEAGTALKMTQTDTAVKLSGLTGLKVNQDTFTRDDHEYIPMDTGNELSADSLQAEKEYLIGENISGDGSTALMEDSDGDGQADTVISVIQKAVDLSSCTLSLSAASFVYDGTEKKPAVTVKNGSEILVRDTDYEVSYSNNRNAGTASVTVTGKGRVQGAVSAKFAIQAAPVSGCSVTLSATRYYYNGKAFRPGVTVKKGSAVLKNGTHYTVSYANNVNIGTASVTVTGKGNYSGTVRKTYTVTTAAGRTYTVGALKYKITKAASNGTGTVAVIAPKSRNYTGITIPSVVKIGGVNFKVTTIYLRAFRNCKRLKKVVIGNNVTTICHYAFQGCTRLQYVAVGSRVRVIGKYAFYGDKALKGITIKSKYIRTVGAGALKGIYGKAVLKVPRAKYAAYKRLFRGKGLSSRVTYRRY